ncbi:MAG: DUF1682 domain-containing protein, partial [Oligosphaeraceae bacterium]|nr:DUF1682 domain-containing protein [Oligosphaeraceae bacterium]
NAGYGWFEENQAATEQLAKRREDEQKKREEEQKEAEKLAQMTPEQRIALEEKLAAEATVKAFVDGLPVNDREGVLKGKMGGIDQLSEEDQRILCRAIKWHFAKMWDKDRQEAEKAKGPDDKKFGKAYKRVEKIRQAAEKLGEEMP